MRYWIFVYTPESYADVCKHGITRVGKRGLKTLTEVVKEGDSVIAYISKQKIFDGYGKITGQTVVQSKDESQQYPWSRKIEIEKKNLKKPVGDLFWGLDEFNTCDTTPGNLLTLKGGMIEIRKDEFEWLLKEIKK